MNADKCHTTTPQEPRLLRCIRDQELFTKIALAHEGIVADIMDIHKLTRDVAEKIASGITDNVIRQKYLSAIHGIKILYEHPHLCDLKPTFFSENLQ